MEPFKVTQNSIQEIDPEKLHLINELTITEDFFVRDDLPILRRMCNSIENGTRTGGNLKSVDLSKNNIYAYENRVWFKDCITLKEIKLPYTFEAYAQYFSGCLNLESIEISPTPEGKRKRHGFYSKDGVVFEASNNNHDSLEKYPARKGTEYKIPSDIIRIKDYAFEDAIITSLIMPPIPPRCNEEAFKGIDPTVLTLYVPKGSQSSYWVHPVYSKFKIVELDE